MRYKDVMKQKGVTAKELAVMTGLTEVGLGKIINERTSTNTKIIERIASALGVKCGELFDDFDAPRIIPKNFTFNCPECGAELIVFRNYKKQ